YRAEGVRRLREALATLAEVTVVAPDRNKSGASNSLTLDVPLRVFEAEPGVYFVPGTPTDCVHLAISGLFDFEHDMVVSGVNDGTSPAALPAVGTWLEGVNDWSAPVRHRHDLRPPPRSAGAASARTGHRESRGARSYSQRAASYLRR